MHHRICIWFLLLAGIVNISDAQIVINEFLASNATVNTDPDFNEYSDWVELYNAGSGTANLKGYFLTDNLDNPVKWQITQDVQMLPGTFLLIWTDGEDTGLHAGFRLSRASEEIGLYTPAMLIADTVRFKNQAPDISFGRSPDGSGDWWYFTEPTPGEPNTSTAYPGIVDNVPEFTVLGGLYTSGLEVGLYTDLGGTIRYTLDGSEPHEGSPQFASPIQVSATTIIRARIFKPGMIPGRIITHSYFMNENFQERYLPVISIASDPENFWDPETGIYVQDFKPDWEVPVNIELHENDGSDRVAFNEGAGIKINGLRSWQLPQKMLGVYFRKQYGDGRLDYRLFNDKPRSGFESFALRASGSDWSYTLFRDILIQNATIGRMDVDYMASRPCVVYINGQYMGIHNIREKVDEDFVAQNHGLNNGNFDMVENQEFAEAGDLLAYNRLLDLTSMDLSVEANYENVAEELDIGNFTDMALTHIYNRNTSYNHNLMAWKQRGEGRWKWILMDLDRGFFSPTNRVISNFTGDRDVWPLVALMENPDYVSYFGKRLADHLYTSFNPIRMKQRIALQKELIEDEIPDHVARWLGTTSSYGNAMPSVDYWYQEIEELISFTEIRPGVLLDDLTDYGFSSASDLVLSVSPPQGGYLSFNNMTLTAPDWSGAYPEDLTINLTAWDRPGYDFKGWTEAEERTIIPKNSYWKYLDDGSDQGTGWREVSFNDAAWNTGKGQLGYGEGDEATVLGFGPDSDNKYVTSYFRHTFQLSAEEKSAGVFIVGIMRDDGAIVYLNGTEIIRSNMPVGDISYETLALSGIGGASESEYNRYKINPDHFIPGTNVLAVEVHQSSVNSSDMSFDFELLASLPGEQAYISTERDLSFTLSGNRSLTAVYEATGECILPDEIISNTTLSVDCSPYMVQGDVTVAENVELVIEPGVTLYMSPGSSLVIHGSLLAQGTADKNIRFAIHPDFAGESWGAICFLETGDTSKMRFTVIEDASVGPEPIRDVAAVSAFKSDLVLDHMEIVKVSANPVYARYSDVVLTNSTLHSEITGDLINVKYGSARIENCEFIGNKLPDTDAIDYDEILNGTIRNCLIHDLQGFNSDAIDIGENAADVLIDSVFVYNITDKGVSAGQRSSLTVRNSVFVNCNLGVAVKDSSNVRVDHCTFYSVGTPVACYEKNAGSAGGNAWVSNSILSNSYNASYSADLRSNISIENSISDNNRLPDKGDNRYGNPLFTDPSMLDFRLQAGSPAIGAGDDQGSVSDMGSLFHPEVEVPQVMISNIFYDNSGNPDRPEFLTLYNPSDLDMDIAGFTLSSAVEYTFPQGSKIPANTNIFIVKSTSIVPADDYWPVAYQWTSGSLANEGEIIKLANASGIMLDQVIYSPLAPWPYINGAGKVISLYDLSLDNHFGENWIIRDYRELVTGLPDVPGAEFSVFPNPTSGVITIETGEPSRDNIGVYTLTGAQIYSGNMLGRTSLSLDLSGFRGSMLLIRVGAQVRKCLVLE